MLLNSLAQKLHRNKNRLAQSMEKRQIVIDRTVSFRRELKKPHACNTVVLRVSVPV